MREGLDALLDAPVANAMALLGAAVSDGKRQGKVTSVSHGSSHYLRDGAKHFAESTYINAQFPGERRERGFRANELTIVHLEA